MTSELRALLVVLSRANVALRKKEIFERGREKKEKQRGRDRLIDGERQTYDQSDG
jgi:hypothetical protein